MEEDRRLLFQRLEKVDQRQTVSRLQESKWHVLEILYHCYLSEAGTLKYIKKKLQYSPEGLQESVLISRIKAILLWGVLNSPLKVKAPAGLDIFPEELVVEKIDDEWTCIRVEFQKLIEELSENQLKWLLFKHPFVGRINMPDTVRFVRAHYVHHKRQILRLIS